MPKFDNLWRPNAGEEGGPVLHTAGPQEEEWFFIVFVWVRLLFVMHGCMHVMVEVRLVGKHIK